MCSLEESRHALLEQVGGIDARGVVFLDDGGNECTVAVDEAGGMEEWREEGK